jgi:cytidine deaminase
MKIDLDEIIEVARKTALKSTMRYKISCVLVDKKGNVVATGYNHRSNGSKRMGNNSIHAEVCAINSIKLKKPSNNIVAFIYREHGNRISPCHSCSELLKSYGITTIFCTDYTQIIRETIE